MNNFSGHIRRIWSERTAIEIAGSENFPQLRPDPLARLRPPANAAPIFREIPALPRSVTPLHEAQGDFPRDPCSAPLLIMKKYVSSDENVHISMGVLGSRMQAEKPPKGHRRQFIVGHR